MIEKEPMKLKELYNHIETVYKTAAYDKIIFQSELLNNISLDGDCDYFMGHIQTLNLKGYDKCTMVIQVDSINKLLNDILPNLYHHMYSFQSYKGGLITVAVDPDGNKLLKHQYESGMTAVIQVYIDDV